MIIILFLTGLIVQAQESGVNRYFANPEFWQLNSKPILLVGGMANINLFQNLNVSEEINNLKNAGGNFISCSLSSINEGDEWPFWRSGLRFNLNKPNNDYWKKLDNFLKLTANAGVVVQLEIWSIKDFTDAWNRNPWNPELNNVYTDENTSLTQNQKKASINDFFYSVPALNNDGILLGFQKVFVDQLLSFSLRYNHVLYRISNEINENIPEEWKVYWSNYLFQKARAKGISIQVAQNFKTLEISNSNVNSELFSYYEGSVYLSVVNEEHWNRFKELKKQSNKKLMPLNISEVFGGDSGEWTGGQEHGIERFWRNILGGAAAVQFYQSPEGMGISERAKRNMKSLRMLAKEYDFFTSQPDFDFNLLQERQPDEVYLAFNKDKNAILYFTDGGQVILDFTDFLGNYKLKWLNIEGANWYSETDFEGGEVMELTAPFAGNWIALLKKI